MEYVVVGALICVMLFILYKAVVGKKVPLSVRYGQGGSDQEVVNGDEFMEGEAGHEKDHVQ